MKDPEPRTKVRSPRVSRPRGPDTGARMKNLRVKKLEGLTPGRRRAVVRSASGRPGRVRVASGSVRARPGNGTGSWPRRRGRFAVPAKFCVVGMANALVDFGTLNLLLWYWPAADPTRLALYNTLALVLANANSYLFNSVWTFREQTRRDGPRQGVSFVAQALLNIGVSNGLLWLAAGLLADTALPLTVAHNLAKIISTVGASTFGFLAMRYVVFRPRRSAQRYAEGGSERVRVGRGRTSGAVTCRAS